MGARYFIYEHPKSAASWNNPDVDGLAATEGVMRTELDQCEFGLTSEQGEASAKKPTSLLTDAVEVHRTMGMKCRGGIATYTSWQRGRERPRTTRQHFAWPFVKG